MGEGLFLAEFSHAFRGTTLSLHTPSPPGGDGLRNSNHHGMIVPVITKYFNPHGFKQIMVLPLLSRQRFKHLGSGHYGGLNLVAAKPVTASGFAETSNGAAAG